VSDNGNGKERKISVHVAVPTYGATPAICQLSFGSFIGAGVASGHIQHISEVEGAYIDRARNDLVRMALNKDCSHVVFLDQDMIVPEGSLQRLLKHEVPVVGAIYFGKDDWATPVAFHLNPFARVYDPGDCPEVPTLAGLPEHIESCFCGVSEDHLHRVGGTGMGCTLIDVTVFERMREHFKDELWFSSKETGEDVHFAIRCKEMGIDFLMDGFIQCGHVRNVIVTRAHFDFARQHAPKCTVDGCERHGIFKANGDDRCTMHQSRDREQQETWYALKEV
jgi:hypothetical protein